MAVPDCCQVFADPWLGQAFFSREAARSQRPSEVLEYELRRLSLFGVAV